MAVKISAQLTGEQKEFNGLNRIEAELLQQRHGTRYAVIAFEVRRVSDEIDEGVSIPTIRISHIEPVAGAQADQVQRMLGDAYKDRTGKDLGGDPTLFDDITGDGQEVPEASGEELMAERAERKAAEASGSVTFLPGGEPDAD